MGLLFDCRQRVKFLSVSKTVPLTTGNHMKRFLECEEK